MVASRSVVPGVIDGLARHADLRAQRHIPRARHSRSTGAHRPARRAGVRRMPAAWRPALVSALTTVLRECRPARRHRLVASPVLLLVFAALVATVGGGRAALSRH